MDQDNKGLLVDEISCIGRIQDPIGMLAVAHEPVPIAIIQFPHDHSIYTKEHDLRIPLQLDGIFSYFKTRALTHDEMEYPENFSMMFLPLDPPPWDLYNESYAMNKASYLEQSEGMMSSL